MRRHLLLFILAASLALSACGGGGPSAGESVIARLKAGELSKPQPVKDKRVGKKRRPTDKGEDKENAARSPNLKPVATAAELDKLIAAAGKSASLTEIEFKLGGSFNDNAPVVKMMAPANAKVETSLEGVRIKADSKFHVELVLKGSQFADQKSEYDKFDNRSVLVDEQSMFLTRIDIDWQQKSLYGFVWRIPFGAVDCAAYSSFMSLLDSDYATLEDMLLAMYCVSTLKPKDGSIAAAPDVSNQSLPETIAALKQLGWDLSEEDGEIVSVRVTSEQASDRAMPMLARLKNVQRLDLGDGFTDEGLKHLAGLTELHHLQLNLDHATPKSLDYLKGMTGMTHLEIDAKEYSDASLAALAEMEDMEHLKFARFLLAPDTRIEGPGLKHLAKMQFLEYLCLNSHNINDEGILNLPELASLETLELLGNPLTGKTLGKLKLPALKTLVLAHSRVSDLSGLAAFPNLEYLNLYHSRVRDASLPALLNLPKLKSLDMHDLPISDKGAATLAKLTKLESLELSRSSIHDPGFALLCTLPKLYRLVVSHSPVTDAVFESLKKAPQIKVVELHRTRITMEALEKFKAENPDVRIEGSVEKEGD